MVSKVNAATSAGLTLDSDTSGILQLQTAGTAALTIDTSANVGIGTSSPAGRLDVKSTSAGTVDMRLSYSSTDYLGFQSTAPG